MISFPLDRARRGATIHGPDPAAVTFPVTRRRLEGLRDACIATGGAWARVSVLVRSRNSAAAGEAAAGELLLRPDPPDAIAAMSDEPALGAQRAAGQLPLGETASGVHEASWRIVRRASTRG